MAKRKATKKPVVKKTKLAKKPAKKTEPMKKPTPKKLAAEKAGQLLAKLASMIPANLRYYAMTILDRDANPEPTEIVAYLQGCGLSADDWDYYLEEASTLK
jgi:hypothetical protein